MKFIYVTDLHGDADQYDDALNAALAYGAGLIANGGDMLPKNGEGGLIEVQREFIRGRLRRHFEKCVRNGIRSFAAFGNDDCRALLPELDGLARDGLVTRMDTGWTQHEDWHFAAFPWVPDTPFLLKDWCLIDHRGWTPPPQFGPPLLSTPEGFTEFQGSSLDYLGTQPTIEEKLESAPYSKPPDPRRCAFVMHAPPAGTSLDVTWDGKRIGSSAGREYILKEGFGLSLHGHVHESPQETGVWSAGLGRTLSVNPGAGPEPNWVLFDTDARTARHARLGLVSF